jgi:ribosomal protein L21E
METLNAATAGLHQMTDLIEKLLVNHLDDVALAVRVGRQVVLRQAVRLPSVGGQRGHRRFSGRWGAVTSSRHRRADAVSVMVTLRN